MTLPFNPTGFVLPAGRWLAHQAIERPVMRTLPRLTVRPATPPKQARESWLDWIHLEVENVRLRRAKRTRPASNVQAKARVSGVSREWVLFWSNADPNGRPARRCQIDVNFPQGIPLVVRSEQNATNLRDSDRRRRLLPHW
jgi:hypothetical protein